MLFKENNGQKYAEKTDESNAKRLEEKQIWISVAPRKKPIPAVALLSSQIGINNLSDISRQDYANPARASRGNQRRPGAQWDHQWG